MSEEKTVGLRLLAVVLGVANLIFVLYLALSPDPRREAAQRIDELQINPGRIRLIEAATRGPGGHAADTREKRTIYRACLEWGPFSGAEIAKADNALARLALSAPPLQRPADGAKRVSYFVREPDAATVARIAELQRSFPGTAIKAGPCP